MSVSCKSVQEQLAASVSATLGQDTKQHLDSCAECQAFQLALQEVDGILSALPNSTDVHDSVARVTKRAIQADVASRHGRFWWLSFVLPLGVVAAIVIFTPVIRLLTYLEGSIGALLMLSCMVAALLHALVRKFRFAASFATLSVCIFLARSTVSTFFNDRAIVADDVGGRMEVSPHGTTAARGLVYNDTRLAERSMYDELVEGFGSANAPVGNRPESTQPAVPSKADITSYEKRTAEIFSDIMRRIDRAEKTDIKEADGLSLPKPSEAQVDASKDRMIDDNKGKVIKTSPLIIQADSNFSDKKAPLADGKRAGEGFEKEFAPMNELRKESAQQFSLVLPASPENLSLVALPPGTVTVFVGDDIVGEALLLHPPLRTGTSITVEIVVPASKFAFFNHALRSGKAVRVAPANGPTAPTATPFVQGMNHSDSPSNAFSRFLAEHKNIQHVTFQKASGYWENTYTPGDQTLLRLATHLREPSQQALLNTLGAPVSLHELSQRTDQPFDSLSGSALSIFLHADENYIVGPRRVVLQVGLRSATRRSSTRSSMNIVFVYDGTRTTSAENQNIVAKMFEVLQHESGFGDRIGLVAAGQHGGVLIRPGEFRYGTVSIALKKLFEHSSDKGSSFVSLPRAFESAHDLVHSQDSGETELGNNVIVFLSPHASVSDLTAVLAAAELDSVAGVVVSAMGIGEDADIESLGKIARSGQGNRRLVLSISDAESAIKAELYALSRVVARAIRLKIKLAEGVQLVGILGSHPLGTPETQVVRAVEQSIDLHMAHTFGIAADRGQDEEGIQIVIPAFNADDTHAILLDVVVPGPGSVAEVTARYKDVIAMNNAVAQASLSLGQSPKPLTALELNVLKNLLAY